MLKTEFGIENANINVNMGGTKGIIVSIKLAKSNNNFIGKVESTLANFTFESKVQVN